MKKIFFTLLFCQFLFAADSHQMVGFRYTVSPGVWMSNYQQKVPGHEVKVSTLLSLAIGMQAGLRVSILFAEYSIIWCFSPYSERPKSRDATYFSMMGGNIGLSFGGIPIEPYAGVEQGRYALSSGGEPTYTTSVLKAGVNLVFPFVKDILRGGIKAEYRRMTPTEDSHGVLPSGITTTAEVYLISFMFGL